MAESMRAVVVTEHGGVEVLEVRDVPRPDPGPGQLLVEVAASGVNFIDVYQREGIYPIPTPFVLGGECGGRVVALGADVDEAEFPVGSAVATASAAGTHAQYVALDAAQAVPVPDGVDPATAAAAMLQGMTAHYLVNATHPLSAGETILVHAGAGGVGQLLIQMAKQIGAQVVTTVGSEEKVAVATAAGADAVIRYDQIDGAADLASAVRDVAPSGVHVAYDGVGRSTFDASLASLRPRGLLVLFGAASGQVPPFELQRLNSGGSLFVTRPTLANYLSTREELLERANGVLGAVASGALRVDIGGRYPLAEVAQAYRDLQGRATRGKLLLLP